MRKKYFFSIRYHIIYWVIIVIEGIKEYIKDSEFRFTVYTDKIDIVNYRKIISLEDEKIIFLGDTCKIVVLGKNLTLNKLLDQEILIVGNILKIEVLHE